MTTQRKTIIAGNWKMNKTPKEARELASAVVESVKTKTDLPEIVLCPAFVALHDVLEVAKAPR